MDKGRRVVRKISRRQFIKNAGMVAGGLATGIGGAAMLPGKIAGYDSDVKRAIGHITQVSPSKSACTGCGTCEVVCSALHDNACGPGLRRIWLSRDEFDLTYQVNTCLQCPYPACYFACPEKGKALCIDKNTGIRFINSARCRPGCTECLDACLFAPARINMDPETGDLLMCDLCKDRPEGPACIEFCPAMCLQLSTEES